MAKPVTRTTCLDCKVKLTSENRYPSVRSRCKLCHIAKVKAADLTQPPQTPYCRECDLDLHRCRGCGADIPHGRIACDDCLGTKPQEGRGFSVRCWYIRRYKALGLQEYLPRVLAEL